MTDPDVANDEQAPVPRASALSRMTRGGVSTLPPLTLVLVRHGVTDMTITHALSGSGVPGPALNAAGRVQAAKAADAVHGIGRRSWLSLATASRVLASPMVRTQETAAAIGRRLGVHVETDARLKEVDFGRWEGLTGHEVAAAEGDAIHAWRFGEIAAPGGESMGDVAERMTDLLQSLAAAHAAQAESEPAERTWVLVSHAVAIKSAVGAAMAMPRSTWGSLWPLPASLTILQLRVTPGGEVVETHLHCLGAPTT